MSDKGNCYDNTWIRSFHSVIKKNGFSAKSIEPERELRHMVLLLEKYNIQETLEILKNKEDIFIYGS